MTLFETKNKIQDESRLISRRKFLYGGILSVSAVAITGCVSGIITRKNIEITHKTIELPNLPPAFKGLTITLACDIHSSPYMSLEDMQEIAGLINGLKSDVILLPGDFVTGHKNELPPVLEALSVLRAPMGVFATTGNHEFYVGADMVSEGISDIGIRMMRNENLTLEKKTGKSFTFSELTISTITTSLLTQKENPQNISTRFSAACPIMQQRSSCAISRTASTNSQKQMSA